MKEYTTSMHTKNYGKTRLLLINKTEEELSYIFGHYCGPNNTFLSIKHFGFVLNQRAVSDCLVDIELNKVLIEETETP